MTVTIYHNPNCSKSRDALRFLTASGIEPEIVLYLKEGWSHDQLIALKTACSMDWTDMLRPDAGALLKPFIIADDDVAIINYLVEHPEALERPFVQSPIGVRLCRPLTRIIDIIDQTPESPWLTEKGEQIL